MLGPEQGIFVTGTGTGVGKTRVAALIARSLFKQGIKVGVYKPAASDCRMLGGELVSEDAMQLWKAAGQPLNLEAVCPQRFQAPLAPHLAARQQGETVDASQLRSGLEIWRDHCDFLIVEGAGGLMSPLTDDEFNADLAADIGYPLIVVAPNELGTINQTLQTLITAETFATGLSVAGIVLNDIRALPNDESVQSNRAEIERLAIPPLLAHVPFQNDIGEVDLNDENSIGQIDWIKLNRLSS